VRTLLTIAILASATLAPAQEAGQRTEVRRQQVFGEPDQNRTFDLKQLSPFGRAGDTFRTKAASSDSFYFQQKFQPKSANTKEFKTDSFWAGNFMFSTKEAATKSYETREAATKTAPTRTARDTDKTASTRPFVPGEKEARIRGRSQDEFDRDGPSSKVQRQSWSGDLRPLTVEDVRDILNKSK
jgi:hypothetical protein